MNKYIKKAALAVPLIRRKNDELENMRDELSKMSSELASQHSELANLRNVEKFIHVHTHIRNDRRLRSFTRLDTGESSQIKHYGRDFSRVAADVTNYCNARCVFCFSDWEQNKINTTKEIFAKFIDMMQLVEYQGFFFSCLYEPTLNPDFIDLLEMIPARFRNKVFFTTNLVRHIPDEMIHRLAKVNVSFINISLETFDQILYNKLTNTKKSFFYDNLERISDIFIKYPLAPNIRLITMILKDNYNELISLAKTVNERYIVKEHEFRTPIFFSNDNTEHMADQLMPEKDVKNIVKKLKELNFGNMCFDFIDGTTEAYKTVLESKEQESNTQADNNQLSTDNKKTDRLNTYSPTEHYAIRLNSNGTGQFINDYEWFNLIKIDRPLLYFQSKLADLQNEEAALYADCDQSLIKKAKNNTNMTGKLEQTLIYDSRYMFLYGWVKPDGNRDDKPEMFIILNESTLYRSRIEERLDIVELYGPSCIGFSCCIDLRDVEFENYEKLSLQAAIMEDETLECAALAEFPLS